jgi:hypothetical protein
MSNTITRPPKAAVGAYSSRAGSSRRISSIWPTIIGVLGGYFARNAAAAAAALLRRRIRAARGAAALCRECADRAALPRPADGRGRFIGIVSTAALRLGMRGTSLSICRSWVVLSDGVHPLTSSRGRRIPAVHRHAVPCGGSNEPITLPFLSM